MQLCEEEDDATSPLAAPKPEPNDQSVQVGGDVVFQEVGFLNFMMTLVMFCVFYVSFANYEFRISLDLLICDYGCKTLIGL